MAYIDEETSIENSKPIEVYEIREGATFWYYTSNSSNIILDGKEYISILIKRSKKNNSNNENKNKIDIEVSITNNFAISYINKLIEGSPSIIVKRYQGTDSLTIFSGIVSNVSLNSQKAIIRCDPLQISLKRTQCWKKYQLACPYNLYSTDCKVNKDSYKANATIQTIDGLTLTSSTFALQPDDYYLLGYLNFNGTQRMITFHKGNTIELTAVIPGLSVFSNVEVFAGCQKFSDICLSKFNNLDNFGGFPYIPDLNPFQNSILT